MAQQLAEEKIKLANCLLKKIQSITVKDIFGVQKLRKKIEAEINFLTKGLNKDDLKVDHVLCSNLGQLSEIVNAAISTSEVTAVLKKFTLLDGEKLIVDVVGNGTTYWYKIILRNPKALHQTFVMGSKKGTRPLDQIAYSYIEAAELHPVLFKPPQIVFIFINGVSESISNCLVEMGIKVEGDVFLDRALDLPDFSYSDSDNDSTSDEVDIEPAEIDEQCSYIEPLSPLQISTDFACDAPHADTLSAIENSVCVGHNSSPKIDISEMHTDTISHNCRLTENYSNCDKNCSKLKTGTNGLKDKKRVNLDVSCMIAYTSATTNGECDFIFKGEFLTEQAMWERKNPVKGVIDKYIEGCELIVCKNAADHFLNVLETVGGNKEIERGKTLLDKCTIVDSVDFYKDDLPLSGRIKYLSRLTFGTGQALKAPTVTSNLGFIRAAENKGLKLACLYHEPRALTEKKQPLAVKIKIS